MLAPFATVTDAADLDYTVTYASLVKASSRIRTYLRSEGYSDPDPIPDSLVDLTCAIAQRIASMSKALADGQQSQQQSAGPFQQSVTYGWDAWKAKSGLDAGELNQLKTMFPHVPRSISMGSPVDLHEDEQ